MKNIIFFFSFVLFVMVSSVNAQNTVVSNSTSIVLSQGFSKVPTIVEDVDVADSEVRNIAMMQEEFIPETATAALMQSFHTVANVIEDVDANDISVRSMAMMQEEFSPEMPETNIARNGNEVTAKY